MSGYFRPSIGPWESESPCRCVLTPKRPREAFGELARDASACEVPGHREDHTVPPYAVGDVVEVRDAWGGGLYTAQVMHRGGRWATGAGRSLGGAVPVDEPKWWYDWQVVRIVRRALLCPSCSGVVPDQPGLRVLGELVHQCPTCRDYGFNPVSRGWRGVHRGKVVCAGFEPASDGISCATCGYISEVHVAPEREAEALRA